MKPLILNQVTTMSSAIIPEIVGQTEILLDSPMTPQELQRQVEVEAIFLSADSTKDEQRLIQGKCLIILTREGLFRGNDGKRTWPEYLKEYSHKITADGEPIKLITSHNLRAFYMLQAEILPKFQEIEILPSITQSMELMGYIPLPNKYPKNYNDEDKEKITKAIKIWKTACGKVGINKKPSCNIVKQIAYEQRALDNKLKPRINTTQELVETPKQVYDPSTESANKYVTPDYQDESPPIKTWEQERNTQEVDPYSECKKLHDVLYEAEKSLQDLHGVLYHQINKYGSAYLNQMKQFDAGLYSVSDIDEKIDSLHEQTSYLVDLLQKEVEPNDLVNG
jgi:hypothetical protein